MPQTYALASYTIKIKNLGEREWEKLSDFGDGADLLDFFASFFTGLKAKASDMQARQQLIRVKEVTKDADGRRVYGIVETGEYGTETDIVNVKTNKLAYRRKRTEADMWPFYFMVDIPEGVDEGFLVLQRSGNFGIRQFLYEMFTTKFDIEHDDFRLELSPLVESKDIERYQAGRIEVIRFIKHSIPKDITDAFDSGHQEKLGRVEFVVYARRKYSLPLAGHLRRFFASKKPANTFMSLVENNFKPDDVKVATRVGNARRTLDLNKLGKLRSYHDISDTVDIDEATGQPDFESIHREAESLLKRVKQQMYRVKE